MSFRRRPRELQYIRYRTTGKSQKKECVFCAYNDENSGIVDNTKHFWIVKNAFPYDLWDDLDVLEHLMIVPHAHTESLATLPEAAIVEYGKLLARYEDAGFSFYARAQTVITKSVPHQHTHLIKLDNKQKKAIFYLKKPYMLWYK